MKTKVLLVVLTLMVTAIMFFILDGIKIQTSSEYKEPCVVTFIEPTQPRFTREDTLRVMAMAFAMQESKCTEMAVSPCGKYVGCLQISEIMTREANRVQNKEQFTYDDRYKKMGSFKIFYVVMEYHNPELNIDCAIDIWNVNCPDVYRNNVKANYNLLLENIEQFLIDKEESNDEIEVLNRVWEWIRKIYHTQGKEKLKTYDKNL